MTNRDPFSDFVNSEEFDNMDDFEVTTDAIGKEVFSLIEEANRLIEEKGMEKFIIEDIGKFNYKIILTTANYAARGYMAQWEECESCDENVDLDNVAFEIPFYSLVDLLITYGQLVKMALHYVPKKFDQ